MEGNVDVEEGAELVVVLVVVEDFVVLVGEVAVVEVVVVAVAVVEAVVVEADPGMHYDSLSNVVAATLK